MIIYPKNFVDEEHEKRFNELITSDFGWIEAIDSERLAVVYLFAGNDEVYEKARSYFNSEGYHWEELFQKEDLSSTTKALIQVSIDVFNGEGYADLTQLSSMSDENIKLVLYALSYRYNVAL